MTNEFAIKDLKGLAMFEHREEFIHTMDVEAINTAIDALEKQIPKPPVKIRTSGFFKCPVCDKVLNLYEGNYCSSCGQALEWEVLNVQGS